MPNNKPVKKTITVKERLNNIMVNINSESYMSKYYMESNVDLLKRVLSEKLKKNPTLLLNKSKRDQQKQLQETTKEFINSFEILSGHYFKKVGDEYLVNEFSDLLSEHMMKQLADSLANTVATSVPVADGRPSQEKNQVDRGRQKSATSRTGLRSIARRTAQRSSSLAASNETKGKKDEAPVEHPLASIKGQIPNIDEFIQSYVESDREIEERKADIVKLEDSKKSMFNEIVKLKDEIVKVV